MAYRGSGLDTLGSLYSGLFTSIEGTNSCVYIEGVGLVEPGPDNKGGGAMELLFVEINGGANDSDGVD